MNFISLSIENWALYTSDLKMLGNSDGKFEPIPANLKRRCSKVSEIALKVANQAKGQANIDHAIFCSQHGELGCAANLLKDIAHKNLLSPMHFSQSVHNTAAGLFSIMHNLHQDIVAIAAGANTFLMGMLEAFTWMQLNPNKTLLFVMYDAYLPEEYKILNIRNDNEYAVAFLLTDDGAKKGTISLNIQMCNEWQDCIKKSPAALEFLEWFLHSTTNELIQDANQQSFIWHKINA